MKLVLNKTAMLKRRRKFVKAQNYVDQECLKRMRPLVPVALPEYAGSGKLRDSGRVEKPGKIVYTARHARHSYYAKTNHRHGGNPNARRRWFEVMKSSQKHQIGAGAAKIMGARYSK